MRARRWIFAIPRSALPRLLMPFIADLFDLLLWHEFHR